ncbi:MAG TPA: peptidoglycan DD-metalloendopeptidase family protein [Methylococcaceae bacterium]|nr:peptidoglycan DD-metalloendopeptidase family protein [Methylococcaceae bacterium]
MSGPAAAAPDDKDPAGQIQARIRAVRESLGLDERQQNSVQGELAAIERQYGSISQKLRLLDDKIAGQQDSLSELRERRGKMLEALEEQTRLLERQVRAAYSGGRQEWLKLLFNQEDPARSSRILTYYHYLNRDRLASMASTRQAVARLDGISAEIAAENAQLERLRQDVAGERSRLESLRQARETALVRLRRDVWDKQGQVRVLEDNLRRLERLVASVDLALQDLPAPRTRSKSARPKPVETTDGGFSWPVEGEVTQRFGQKRLTGRWDGVLIKTREGEPVRAASAGRVVFADWLQGYGLLAIIDHGDGYMSLYAFNQSLYRNVGEAVQAGDVISTVGRSGGRNQPALYFGVRHTGQPIDPLKWLKRRG